MKKAIALLSPAIFMLMLSACEEAKNEYLVGTAEDVRIVNKLELESDGNKSGDAAIGALIGGMLTGGIGGAAVGAAVGADGSPKITTVVKPVACKFFTNIVNEGRLEFVVNENNFSSQVSTCLLLRTGDQIRIRKQFWDNKTSYSWITSDGLEVSGVIIK